MFDEHLTDLLVRDVLRGTVDASGGTASAHRLPLCDYCDHSYLDHTQPDPRRPEALLRCHIEGCGCDDLRDPSVQESEESGGKPEESRGVAIEPVEE